MRTAIIVYGPMLFSLAYSEGGETTTDFSKSILEEKVEQPDSSDWKFSLGANPYAPISVTGDVGLGGVVTGIDLDLRDVLNGLDMTSALTARVEKGKWGLSLDVFYAG